MANSKIGQIVDEINPIKPGATSLGVVLWALAAGFAFIAVPAQLEVSLGLQVATQAGTALQQAPGLGKALLPTGSLDSEFKQLTSIQDSLGQVLSQTQVNVANALKSAQDNFDIFSNITANGAYIAKQPSLNASTAKVTSVLDTFIVSQALQANNIVITVARNTNPYEVSQNLSSSSSSIAQQNAWHVNCHDNFTKEQPGICDNWWYDGEDAYSLYNLGDLNKNYYELMNKIFDEGWTTPQALFYGAETCRNQSYSFNSVMDNTTFSNGRDVSVGWTGQLYIRPYSLDAQCVANVRICNWNTTHDPYLQDGRELVSDHGNAIYPWKWGYDQFAWLYEGSKLRGFDPCSLAYPWHCGWFLSDVLMLNITEYNLTGPELVRLLDPSIPEEVIKECDTPTIEKNLGWGGAGYTNFRATNPCQEYPASYIGDGLWTYGHFCSKPKGGF